MTLCVQAECIATIKWRCSTNLWSVERVWLLNARYGPVYIMCIHDINVLWIGACIKWNLRSGLRPVQVGGILSVIVVQTKLLQLGHVACKHTRHHHCTTFVNSNNYNVLFLHICTCISWGLFHCLMFGLYRTIHGSCMRACMREGIISDFSLLYSMIFQHILIESKFIEPCKS